MALLAAIPQSPTKFDLVKNAVEEDVQGRQGRRARVQLVVPADSEVVDPAQLHPRPDEDPQRPHRRPVHATRSTRRRRREPVDPRARRRADKWRAPQFVWQVRDELGQILCGTTAPTSARRSTRAATRSRRRSTTRCSASSRSGSTRPRSSRNSKNPDNAAQGPRQIPQPEWGWIKGLRGHNIHNAAGGGHGLPDRRGPRVRRVGVSYTAKGNTKFQPQFDVLSDGWRQPGFVDQAARLPHRHRGPHDDGGDDVHGRRDQLRVGGLKAWYPTQADGLERGPVRLRNALQFSLNIPAIKAGFVNGLDHQFERMKDFGLAMQNGTQSRCRR